MKCVWCKTGIVENNDESYCSDKCWTEAVSYQEMQEEAQQEEERQQEPTREMMMDGGMWDFDNDRPR